MTITRQERAHVIQLLHDSQNEFLELISKVTGAQWAGPAAPGAWSVQHTAEHLVLGEKAIFAKVEEALASPPEPDWQEADARKTDLLGRVLADRSRKAIAPQGLEPHRDWTRDETIARYKSVRARTLKFAEEVDQPMKDRLAGHPFPVFNMLNAYQWLLYIPLHNIRHNQQIAAALKELVP